LKGSQRKLDQSRSDAIDVKLHEGGIRDIEFLTQCLQRLHGGEDRWVRSGGTLLALRKLNDKGWISDRDYATLVSAYEFLRNVEHRVQFELGLQTHRLPTDDDALDRLARRTGIESSRSPGKKLLRKSKTPSPRSRKSTSALCGRIPPRCREQCMR